MSGYMNIRKNKLRLMTAAFTLVAQQCTFNNNADQPLTIKRIDTLGDTVAAFASLRFAFSEPVVEKNAGFSLMPDNPGFFSDLNELRDTVSFVVNGLLAGNTDYIIDLAKPVTSASGAVLKPGDATFSFHTNPVETEPNQERDSSRMFERNICGFIEDALDTDIYFMNSSSFNSVYLSSNDGAILALEIDGISGADTSVLSDAVEKTISFPGGTGYPCYIKIYSLLSSGRYKIDAR
jgi:hypothetical protein